MLQTRLWMGTLLAALAIAGLVVDQSLPFHPVLLVVMIAVCVITTLELHRLLIPPKKPTLWLSLTAVCSVMAANWLGQIPNTEVLADNWVCVLNAFTAVVLVAFLVEMIHFREPGESVSRVALVIFMAAYLALLPSFLVQLRWLHPEDAWLGTMAIIATIAVPKGGDVGAYLVGRYFGRHRMTPSLSPKKTWEGATGGMTAAVVVAVITDRVGPVPVLRNNWLLEVGFGITLGLAGIAGDLAESLIKRDLHRKDASQNVPGFGGLLDVVDAIFFAAPIGYLWFWALNKF